MRHGFVYFGGYTLALLCGASVFAPNHAFAADDSISEQAYLQDLPVVLTASRLSQPLSEAPNAVTVIDQAMIKASGFRNIADLLRLVPGMYVGNLNGYTPIVSYHGTTDNYARRMQVLVDGRSVYFPPYGGVNWEDIPILIDDIERIEVIRGPAAASHGANSTQGVINIITHEASGAIGTRVSVAQGGGGISDGSARFGQSGEQLDYRFSIGSRSDTGYDSLHDSNRTRLANWRSNYRPNASDSFDVQLGFNQAVRGDGVGKTDGTSPFRDVRSSVDYQQISWNRALSQGDDLKLQYNHTHTTYDDDTIDFVTGTSRPFPRLNIATQRHDVELQHITQWNETNRLVWGLGARSDAVTAPLGFGSLSPTLHQSRVFAHDEWRVIPSAVVNAGAMWENDGMGHRNVSPRLSVNYHVAPQHTLRIGSSIAYRNPSALEEYGNTQPAALRQIHVTGGLQPEKMLSREIGYFGEFSLLGVTADVRIYSDQLSDLIYMDSILYQGAIAVNVKNLYNVNFRGLESTIKYRWSERDNLTLNLSRQLASCSSSSLPTYYSDPMYGSIVAGKYQEMLDQCPKMVPFNSGSLLLTQQVVSGLAFNVGYYYQGEMQVLDALIPQAQAHRIDIKISKGFGNPEKSGGGEVALVVQNVYQDNYNEYANTRDVGKLLFNRRTYLTTTINF
jgi:iron complex outermembrane receptor protein